MIIKKMINFQELCINLNISTKLRDVINDFNKDIRVYREVDRYFRKITSSFNGE